MLCFTIRVDNTGCAMPIVQIRIKVVTLKVSHDILVRDIHEKTRIISAGYVPHVAGNSVIFEFGKNAKWKKFPIPPFYIVAEVNEDDIGHII